MWAIIIDFINRITYKSHPELDFCILLTRLEEGRLLNRNH